MNRHSEEILTKLFLGKTSLDDVSIEDIDQQIQKYPYCQSFYFLKMYKERELHKISSLSLMTPHPLFSFHLGTARHDFAQRHIEDNTWITTNSYHYMEESPSDKDTGVDFATIEASTQHDSPDVSSDEPKVPTSMVQADTPKKETKKVATKRKKEPGRGSKKASNQKQNNSLKSFMEWLNSMDALSSPQHLEKLEGIKIKDDVVEDSKKSIRHHEIITESMAIVWLDQNEPLKAVEVYEKLSLLFPDKSSYFADKINEIKQQFGIN